MARTKLPNYQKKEKMTLTVPHEVKEMAETLRVKGSANISQLLEECIRKEYKRLMKSAVPSEPDSVPGQMELEDVLK